MYAQCVCIHFIYNIGEGGGDSGGQDKNRQAEGQEAKFEEDDGKGGMP